MNKEKLTVDLKGVLARGIKSLAIVLLHSYTFPDHEQEIGTLAREIGFTHVSLSSRVMPMVRIVPRGYTGIMIIIIVTVGVHACHYDTIIMLWYKLSVWLKFQSNTCQTPANTVYLYQYGH